MWAHGVHAWRITIQGPHPPHNEQLKEKAHETFAIRCPWFTTRGSRPVVRAPPVGVSQGVTGRYLLSVTHKPVYYQALSYWCHRCHSFFELYLRFFKNTVFFYKSNFNSKLPVTPVTPATDRMIAHFSFISTCDTACDTLWQTCLYLWHTTKS